MNAAKILTRALAELQARPQWVAYCLEEVTDKEGKTRLTKIPYNARTGYKASSTKPNTWTTYEQAEQALHNARNATGKPYDGIGYVFNGDIIGIDLDHCIDEQGNIDAWALEIVMRIASYAEISPSGTGIHILVRGNLQGHKGTRRLMPDKRHKEAAIELYSEGRFFTITGNASRGHARYISRADRGNASPICRDHRADKKEPGAAPYPRLQ